MTSDGKINSGTGWVGCVSHGPVMIAVLERWYYVHGPEPGNDEVEYRVNGEAIQ